MKDEVTSEGPRASCPQRGRRGRLRSGERRCHGPIEGAACAAGWLLRKPPVAKLVRNWLQSNATNRRLPERLHETFAHRFAGTIGVRRGRCCCGFEKICRPPQHPLHLHRRPFPPHRLCLPRSVRLGEDTERRSAGENRCPIRARVRRHMVHAVTRHVADRASSVWHRIHADGGPIPRQRIRPPEMSLLAENVSRERLRHRPSRQMAHRNRHRSQPRLGSSDCLEPTPLPQELG